MSTPVLFITQTTEHPALHHMTQFQPESKKDTQSHTLQLQTTICIDEDDEDHPPDGGYGWVCCLCGFVVYFSIWGSNTAFGVFLSFYINNNLFDGATRMDYAWIVGILVFTAQILSPLVLTLDKLLGLKITMSFAVFLHCLGYVLASFATKLWHLYVCQGVIVGSAYGFIFIPISSIIPEWFDKKRSFAAGLMATGTGLGGLFYSLVIQSFIDRTGDEKWALRFVGISTAVLMTFATVFAKHRNPPPRPPLTFQSFLNIFKGMFRASVMRKPLLWVLVLWYSLTLLANNMIIYSYATVSTTLGLSQKQAAILTALMNTAQIIGRPSMGFIADWWVGRTNLTMILHALTMIFILAFWIPSRSFGAFLGCGICLGLTIGATNVMGTVFTAILFEPEEFSSAWAMLNVVQGCFALFAVVVAIAMEDPSQANAFVYAEVFGGVVFFCGVLLLIPVREFLVRKELKNQESRVDDEELYKELDTLKRSYIRRALRIAKV